MVKWGWKGVEQAIWGGNGLSGEARMEGGGTGNLGWRTVRWGWKGVEQAIWGGEWLGGGGRGWNRQFGVENG